MVAQTLVVSAHELSDRQAGTAVIAKLAIASLVVSRLQAAHSNNTDSIALKKASSVTLFTRQKAVLRCRSMEPIVVSSLSLHIAELAPPSIHKDEGVIQAP